MFLRFDSNIIFFFGTKTVLGLYCEEENIDTGLGTFVSFCQNQSRLDATSTGRADDRGAVGKYLVIDQAPQPLYNVVHSGTFHKFILHYIEMLAVFMNFAGS